ncbi:S-(hydroxymethyl)glutathione dehydrogenase/alcohol dehydrogenase [Pseudonocardia sediminis]|uniref:S-(Hydroxymethyl)glutathione dehydrogenase/alcohol dehydrogenase n=1 Tax=Pseudonocardia sediminis TaxID=1397368 RepID=A0A4Q7UXN7_PSEST|nr:NDMA-dependent alcohol dehydrogenase [Pseudonocardia sediminis]RZT86666.1 S-(hydroxymethyl)glutathione dehydrogenase/alcohol dehydrogenase [Pseudonocardia sediminis]
MRTEAAVLWETGGAWDVREVELGEPVTGEVRVRLAASGICHTDDHLVTGGLPQPLPAIGGHEGAGVVEAVGPGVTDVAPGDPVVLIYIPSCGRCRPCAQGRQNLCERGAARREGRALADDSLRFSSEADGVGITTMSLLGTFARHTVVHESQVLKIEGDIPLVPAALVGCGVTAGVGAALHGAEVRAGDVVAVVGVGGLGAAAIQGARIAGARIIVAIEPVEAKHATALSLGATHVVSDSEKARALIEEISWGRMANAAILTTDLAHGEYLGPTMELLGKNGRAAVVAVAPPDQRRADLSLLDLTLYEKQVRGTLYGSRSPRAAIPELLDLYRADKLTLDGLITTRYRLSEINQGFDDLRAATNIRGLIVYDD